MVFTGFVGGMALMRAHIDPELPAVSTASAPSTPVSSLAELHAADEKVVNDWLDAMSKGHSGAEYWLNEWWVQPSKLFAVSDWKIMENDGVHIVVRIHSSNRIGHPIVALWRVAVTSEKGTGRRKIYSFENVDKADDEKK